MGKFYTERKEYIAIQWTGHNADELIATLDNGFDYGTDFYVRKVCDIGDYEKYFFSIMKCPKKFTNFFKMPKNPGPRQKFALKKL